MKNTPLYNALESFIKWYETKDNFDFILSDREPRAVYRIIENIKYELAQWQELDCILEYYTQEIHSL